MLIDIGYDWNKDKHCDLDGWFVDKPGGFHRTVIKEGTPGKEYDARRSTMYKTSQIKDIIDVDPFLKPDDLGPILEYSMNNGIWECSSPRLNRALRNGAVSPNQKQAISQIDEIISKSTIKESMRLIRGISYRPGYSMHNVLRKWLTDGVITDLGYLSTTVSLDKASDYALAPESNSILLHIWAPRGSHAFPLFISGVQGTNGDEREILLPRSSKIKITKTSESRVGKRIITSIFGVLS